MKVCGVDLGKDGGIVILDEGVVIFHEVMPVYNATKSTREFDVGMIGEIFDTFKPDYTYIEKALQMSKGMKAIASIHECSGIFKGILGAYNLSYDIISPQRWQKNIFSGLNYKDTKQASIMFARRMAPEINWKKSDRSTNYHHGKTDAFCIATYCWRQNNGN